MNIKKFFRAFGYAFEGVIQAALTERNLKFHLFAAVIVTIAGLWTRLTMIEWYVIIILFGVMFALEIMNSAVERTVDLVTKEIHPLAKQAKDFAAGAVLVFAFISAIIGCLIFIPKWFF